MRTQMGLAEMPTVWHNVDFEEAQLMPYLDRFFTLEARRHFGVYDFVSRIVHPMAVAPESPVYDSADQPDGGAAGGAASGLCAR